MPVTAHCLECDDRHDLGERSESPTSTTCPVCGGSRYRSSADETVTQSQSQRIREAIRDVSGVGESSMENVVESYSTLAGLRNARVSELKQIKHVGETTAENILRELS